MTRKKPAVIAGWDVGGAHLKVAIVKNGVPVAAKEIPCRLWEGLDQLDAGIAACKDFVAGAEIHAVTMTGEMSRIFPDRASGVVAIARHMTAACGPGTLYWMADELGRTDEAIAAPMRVASTNFLATAEIAAARLGSGLLIDMGSTTTDIIGLNGGRPVCDEPADSKRLASGELVYTGLIRSAVMTVATNAPIYGQWIKFANETFANMADVHRILGTLPDDVDNDPTPDGRGKSVAESIDRFARMLGDDARNRPSETWRHAAHWVSEEQKRMIADGCFLVLSDLEWRPASRVVLAGIGAHIAKTVADRLGLPSVMFGDLVCAGETCTLDVTRFAPAAAVAMMADGELTHELRIPS